MNKTFLIFLLSVPFFISTAVADLYECDGKWTNKPCEKAASKTLKEVNPSSTQDKERSKKESLLHDLRMEQIRAKRDFGIKFDISHIEDYCLLESTSVDDCRKETTFAGDKIGTRTSNAALLKAKEESNKIEKEKSKKQESNTVVFIEEKDVILIPRHKIDKPSGVGINIHLGSTGTRKKGSKLRNGPPDEFQKK